MSPVKIRKHSPSRRLASPPLQIGARRRGEKGFTLLMGSVAMLGMVGMVGLAFDFGRMFIAKNELQTFADAAALGAVTQLDGSSAGIQLANTYATQGPTSATTPNGFNFDTQQITTASATYASSFNGTFDNYTTASGSATNSYRFVRVTVSAPVPLYFLPVLPGAPTQQTLTATATAGQMPQSSVGNGGLAPFAPDAHNAADPTTFGFVKGLQYTLKWGNGNTTTCAGDAGFNPGLAPSAHGFVDLGQGRGNSALRGVIVYGGYPNPYSNPSSVTNGTVLYSVPGNRGSSIFSALAERSNQDPDQTSTTWAQYQAAGIGNYRRVITAPVADPSTWNGNGANANVTIVGFGNFLLDLAANISGSSGPICATYIGPGSLNSVSSGGTDSRSVYTTALYQ